MGNQVTLTFAGKTQDLEQSLDRAGAGAEVMAVRVTQATNQAGERFDHLSAQSSLLSGGIGDIGGALTTAFGEETAIGQFGAKMEEASAIVTGFTGVMDLGVFATNNLKLASAAQAVQTGVTSAATKAATAAQWLMNTALLASPITWIVVGIIALIAVIVLVATKTTIFQDVWKKAWGGIKAAASAVGTWFRDTLWGRWIKGAWNSILEKGKSVWSWMRDLPGKLKDKFSSISSFLFAPFRAAFNRVADAWNSTIGQLSWSIPSWVPGIGGNSISAPSLPHFHAGGTVPGAPGSYTPILAMAGETVSATGGGGDGGGWVELRGDAVIAPLLEAIARVVGRRGGDAAQLGIRFR